MANASRNRYRAQASRGVYVDGNTVRHLPVPEERPRQNRRRRVKKQKASRAARRNRERALEMNWGFIFFLTVVCVAILITGVQFLQMKSVVTAKTKTVASLESELSALRADNDAYYSQVMASVDLDAMKKKAIEKLGMKYPTEEQTVYYQTKRSSYVRQYQDVTK